MVHKTQNEDKQNSNMVHKTQNEDKQNHNTENQKDKQHSPKKPGVKQIKE
jgi:hypothetical protein